MIIKHSLKGLLRTPFRTILFLILIAVVTALMILGINMKLTSENLLKEADDKFDTVATLEYMGKNYPDDSLHDSTLSNFIEKYDFEKLNDAPYVLSYEPALNMRGTIADFTMKALVKPYKDFSIIQFQVIRINEEENYASCMLLKTYYAYEPRVDGLVFRLQGIEDIMYRLSLQEGKKYVAHGKFSFSGVENFILSTFDTKMVTNEDFKSFFESWWEPGRRLDTEYIDSYRSWQGLMPDGNIHSQIVLKGLDEEPNKDEWQWGNFESYTKVMLWQQIIATYEAQNNSVPVIVTDNVDTLPEFHQGETYFLEGGVYEKSDGKNVAIISDMMAKQMKLSIGDKLHVDLHYAKNSAGYYDSYWAPMGFDHSADYKIVGIYKPTNEMYANVYIPKTGNESWLPEMTNSYKLGRFVIKNGYGMEFLEEIKPFLESRMTTTVYDQGYMGVAQPLKAMQETALILLIATTACCIAILFLFAYMFITKHKSNIKTMLSLGAGVKRARSYLFLAVLVLGIISIALGATAGYFMSDKIIQSAYEIAEKNSALDMRYSLLYMGSGNVDFKVNFTSDYRYAIICGGAIFIALLLICLSFINATLNFDRFNEYKTTSAKMRRFFGVFRHSFLSIFRSMGRSIIVPIVSAVLVLLLIIYASMLSDNKAKIDTLYDTIPVRAYFTSLDGRQMDGLLLSGELAQDLIETDFVESVNFSFSARYKMIGYYVDEYLDEDDNPYYNEVDKVVIPYDNPFAYERAMAEIFMWDKLVFTNNIHAIPEFFFSNEPKMSFAKGYDASVFNEIEYVCGVSSAFAMKYGLELGDTIRVSAATRSEGGGFDLNEAELKIVCIYAKQSASESIFCPAPLLSTRFINYNFNYDTPEGRYELKYDEETGKYYMVYVQEAGGDASELLGMEKIAAEDMSISAYSQIHSLSFDLKNTKSLSDFKAYLEEVGYSSRGKIGQFRKSITIDDNALILSVSGLQKNVGYMEALYPAIFALVIAIGFVVSYLLTKSRRAELAVMRSMGAGSVKTFFILFTEQLILCIFGAIIGILASLLLTKTFVFEHYISIAIYVACYTAGIAISAMAMNRLNVLKILTSND